MDISTHEGAANYIAEYYDLDSARIITVKFDAQLIGKQYAYFTFMPESDLSIGDPVVVHANDGFSIAYVADNRPTRKFAEKALKWAIEKVDTKLARSLNIALKAEELIEDLLS